jgi:hypothetical protein
MSIRAAIVAVCVAMALAGGRNEADVSINGTIAGLAPGDSVFVTLSRDWNKGVVAPVLFQLDEGGKFALRMQIGSPPPPVTFVRNGTALARLEFKDTWGYSPIVVDKIGGKEFPLTVKSEGFLTGRVALP